MNKKLVPNANEIQSVSNIPRGGIEIKCKTGTDLSALLQRAITELGNNYAIVIPKVRNPKVKITNMSEKLSDTDLIESVKSQNEHLIDAEMKVICVYETKNAESFSSIVEVKNQTFNTLMSKSKIKIGMNVCNVYEFVNVTRCYKCCGYNHKANVCKNNKACLRCGGDHNIKECEANKNECVNCKRTGEKLKLNLYLNHLVWSRECPIYQKKIESGRKRINYAE